MKFVTLHDDEYDKFVSSHKLGGFLHSSTLATHRQVAGWRVHLVGVQNDEGLIVAAAKMTSRTAFHRMTLFECTHGPVLDYENSELVTFFFSKLQLYLRHHNAIRLRISPPLALSRGNNVAKYNNLLQQNGLVHISNDMVDADPQMHRWYASKDLSRYHTVKQLVNSIDGWAQRYTRHALKSGVTIESVSIDAIDEFYEVLSHEGSHGGAVKYDKHYYRELARRYGKDVQFCVARLNLDVYEAAVMKQFGEATTALALISPKNKNKKKIAKRLAAKNSVKISQARLRTIQRLRTESGDSVAIAAAVFVRYGDELVNVASRSYEQFASFNAPYALQWYGQLYGIKHSVKRFNFGEVKNVTNGRPEMKGANLFQKQLGAVVEESTGYFEMYPYTNYSNLVVLRHDDRKADLFRTRSNVGLSIDRTPVLFTERSIDRFQ